MKEKNLRAIVKYLAKQAASRPALATVQAAKDGRQFILNGYTYLIFNNPVKELDEIANTPAGLSVDVLQIAAGGDARDVVAVELSEIERDILTHPGLYGRTIKKGIQDKALSRLILVAIAGKLFNVALIDEVCTICKIDLGSVKGNALTHGMLFFDADGGDISGAILPVRSNPELQSAVVTNQERAYHQIKSGDASAEKASLGARYLAAIAKKQRA